MMIPEFIRFYGYTLNDVLNEYAKTFLSLCNDMYRLQATEIIHMATAVNINDAIVDDLKKQQRGIAGIASEVRIAKKVSKKQ